VRFYSPYIEWAKTRSPAAFDLANSNILPCSIDDLPGACEALSLSGRNDDGYPPLLEAIAARYHADVNAVTTATGTSGANFLACAALIEPDSDVLVEFPTYDPLLAAPRAFGGRVVRFERSFEDGYVLDPDRVASAMTPRTRLIVVTSPHNPTGALSDLAALRAVGRLAEAAGAHVLVDEVYLDAVDSDRPSAALLGDAFITTNSLTKSYGLAGLRCGWALSSPSTTERLRRARDVIDGSGSIVAERLGALAFSSIDRLIERAQRILEVNGQLVREALGERAELEWVDPAGGTVVFPRVTGLADTSGFAQRLLADRATAVVPGRFFEAPAHLRLGFGGDTEALRAGLDAVRSALAGREF
jgi:aspartate/methionine/tyrosine aminotransferase